MISKIQLQKQLNVSASKLQQAISSAGLQAEQVQFSDDQANAIRASLTADAPTLSTASNPINGGSLSVADASLPQLDQRSQKAMSKSAALGIHRARQDAMIESAAYAQEYKRLSDQFDEMLDQVHSQAYVDVEAVLNQLPSGNDGNFFTALLPQSNG